MAKIQSPGQKRKKYVQIISVLIFAAVTYFGAILFGKFNNALLQWTKDHQVVQATVTNLLEEEEEYRGRKGRKRTRTVYSMEYQFEADSETHTNSVIITSRAFDTTSKGDSVTVWYATNDPYTSDTEANIKDELSSNNLTGHLISVAPYTAPGFLFLYYLLSLIFVRESKKALPEGFYTENSWLDIDDRFIVALEGEELVYFNFDKSQASEVQMAYQSGQSIQEIHGISKSDKYKRIPLSEIKELKSDHNSDTIDIEYQEDVHHVEFLNQTVKAHALERIRPLIPISLEYRLKERTRIQATIPSLIGVLIIAGIIWYNDIFVFNLIIGFIGIIYIVPKVFSRLIDPTRTEYWELSEAQKS